MFCGDLFSNIRENKPYTGSFYPSPLRVDTGKPRNISLFSSYGEYALYSPRLPKYGRIASHINATKGP